MVNGRFWICVVIVLMTAGAVEARLVVNEAMVNEPGNAISLEWIELYNDSPVEIPSASFYSFTVGGSLVALPAVSIGAYEYVVLCRKLISDGTSPGFEEVWGNNSGVWGDDESENYETIGDLAFSLRNSGDSIILVRAGTPESKFGWQAATTDGVSLERKTSDLLDVLLSIDPSGSTPGRVNSVTPLNRDLSLDSVTAVSSDGTTRLAYWLTNRGLTQVSDAELSLLPADGGASIDIIAVPPTDVDFTTVLFQSYTFNGLYANLIAALSADDRAENDTVHFTAPGMVFPPVVLNEVLADPTAELGTEWVEVYCQYPFTVSLDGWLIGDPDALYPLSPEAVDIAPGEYIVVAEDAAAFHAYYPDVMAIVLQPDNWATLNNDLETVRLVDSFGIETPHFAYNEVFGDNLTWSRSQVPGREDVWGRSFASGGTPGDSNRVLLPSTGSDLEITIKPKTFSPDGDGFEDEAVISVNAPIASGYTVKIFDRGGRLVQTMADGDAFLRDEYRWDGRDDDGDRVPIGIYILYFEAEGVESAKETLVVAR